MSHINIPHHLPAVPPPILQRRGRYPPVVYAPPFLALRSPLEPQSHAAAERLPPSATALCLDAWSPLQNFPFHEPSHESAVYLDAWPPIQTSISPFHEPFHESEKIRLRAR